MRLRLSSSRARCSAACSGLPCRWSPRARPDSPAARAIQKKIEVTQGKIGRRKGTERVLSTTSPRYSRASPAAGAGSAAWRPSGRLQADLDAKRAELPHPGRAAHRARRARPPARAAAEARGVLAERLVELYQADKPDLVTVVLDAKGFADLLERGEFLARITTRTADHRARARRQGRRRRPPSAPRQGSSAASRRSPSVQARRDEIAEVKQASSTRASATTGTQADKQHALTQVRAERQELEGDLESTQEGAGQDPGRAAGSRRGTPPAGPIRTARRPLIWPRQRPDHLAVLRAAPGAHATPASTSAFPIGTPIRAADAGRSC